MFGCTEEKYDEILLRPAINQLIESEVQKVRGEGRIVKINLISGILCTKRSSLDSFIDVNFKILFIPFLDENN